MIKLVIAGASGRMGRMLVDMANSDQLRRFSSVQGFDKDDDPQIISMSDVVIDFTLPEPTVEHVQIAEKARKAIVIGTTGLSVAQQRIIEQAARSIAIVQSSNMSRGMNVAFREAQNIAKYLRPKSIRISETHHVHKKDKPSGTALTLKEYILSPESAWQGDLPIESVREGEVVGIHSAVFSGWEEEIEIIHRAKSRAPFAAGAIDAACWLVGKRPGIYSMQEVLGLKQ